MSQENEVQNFNSITDSVDEECILEWDPSITTCCQSSPLDNPVEGKFESGGQTH